MASRTTHPTSSPAGRARRTIADEDRPDSLWDMERSLRRRGFEVVAGADEAGRGACAGPLVAAACVLPSGRRGRVPGLADSKLLTAAARERVYAEVVERAVSWSVVSLPVEDLDARGMHVTNIEALRRAVSTLEVVPDYVLSDGFPVPGLVQPGLAVWKGDRVAACVAAASVVAKVTRDRMMLQLHEQYPEYEFAVHKGYTTGLHSAALERYGPCPAHRSRFVNVVRASVGRPPQERRLSGADGMDDDGPVDAPGTAVPSPLSDVRPAQPLALMTESPTPVESLR